MKHITLAFALLSLSVLGAGCRTTVLDRFGIRIEGDHIVFNNTIHFTSGSDEILVESHDLLNGLAQTLNDHPEIHEVRVEGHTDAVGEAADNLALSQRRVAAVVTYLREAGVTQTLTAEGRGETERLCEEMTDECHARNRRVEFVIVN